MENGEMTGVLSASSGHDGAEGVRRVVSQVQDELRTLLKQRADVTRRIGTVKRTILGLAAMFGETVLSKEVQNLIDGGASERKPGFTKACRLVLMEAGHAMSAREVHDQLRVQTPALLAGHKDPIASVTTVLNRLAEYGEAERVVLSNGRRAWQWTTEACGPSQSLARRVTYR